VHISFLSAGLLVWSTAAAQTVSFMDTYDMSNAVPPDISAEALIATDAYPGGYMFAGPFFEVISLSPLVIDTGSVILVVDGSGAVVPGANYSISGAFLMDVKYVSSSSYLISGFVAGDDTSGVLGMVDPTAGGMVWAKRLVILQSNSSPDVRDKLIEGIPLSSGGYVFAGENVDNLTHFDALVLKTDDAGNLEWHQFMGGNSAYGDKARDVAETPSGDIVVAGIAGGFLGNYAGFVSLFDVSGTLLWSNVYGTADDEYIFEIDIANDGGFILAGDHMVGSDTNVLVMKLDASGAVEWAYSYGDAGRTELGRGVVSVADGYVISGTVGADILLFKVDMDGNVVWARTYGGPDTDMGSEVVRGHDGGFAIVGVWNEGVNQDGLLVKTLDDGRVLDLSSASCAYQGDITLAARPLSMSVAAFPTISRSLSLTDNALTVSATNVGRTETCPLGTEDPLSVSEVREGTFGFTGIYSVDGRRVRDAKGPAFELRDGKCRKVIRR